MRAARQGYGQARLRALSICLDLANQGDVTSMYNLGYMCLEGWGGEQDINICIAWLETAAKFGHVRSAKVLSEIYLEGKFGITPDEEKASYWSNIPAAFGNDIDSSLYCYWTVVDLGMSIVDVARRLDITPAAISYSVQLGEKTAVIPYSSTVWCHL